MKLLVVTPTLGTSSWLAGTVANVAALAPASTHVLVAPAGATAELAVRFPRTRVVAEPAGSRGMYAAINAGLAAVDDWEAATYLNDDDLLLPGFARAVTMLAGAPSGPRLAYGAVRLVDDRGRRLGAIPVSPDPRLNRLLYAQRIEPVFQHGTLITRAAMDRLGGFDATLRFCGDSEFLARACLTGIPFVRVPGAPLAAFRLRPGQLTKNRAAMLAERRLVDEKLGLLAPQSGWDRWRARTVFRLANLPVYAERIARHGFISFDELLAQS